MAEDGPPKLSPISPFQLWPHEAHDFTPWLAARLRELASVLDLQLEPEPVRTEVNLPGFGRADIVAVQAETGAAVIIENQLSASDSDHLVRTLGYATGREADIVIWVAGRFDPYHRQILEWLNRGDVIQFYAVEIRGWQIEDSKGYSFNPVVVPTADAADEKRVRLQNRTTGYADFYRPLVARLQSEAGISPMGRGGFRGRYRSFSSGYEYSGAMYATALGEGDGLDRVALRIYGKNRSELHERLERVRETLLAEAGAGEGDWPELDPAVDWTWLGVSRESKGYSDLMGDPDPTRNWMFDSLAMIHRILQPELDEAMEQIGSD